LKKFFLILLIGIYTLSILGYGVKGFYCCGNLKSVAISFYQHNEKEGASADVSKCCETKYQFFKVKDNHFASDHFTSPVKLFIAPMVGIAAKEQILYTIDKIIIANPGNAPPRYQNVPTYLANCTFLI
jgi:hypothetical protein